MITRLNSHPRRKRLLAAILVSTVAAGLVVFGFFG